MLAKQYMKFKVMLLTYAKFREQKYVVALSALTIVHNTILV